MLGPLTLARAFVDRLGHRYELPVQGGNSVCLLEGKTWMQATEALIKGAERSLRFEMYIWADDEVGRRVAAWLHEALARGVIVHGIVDALGSLGSGAMLEELRVAGADLRVFHPVVLWPTSARWNRRNHRKLLLADDTAALVGSANWSVDYDQVVNHAAFADLGLVLTGPSVADLVADFQRLWRRLKGIPLLLEAGSGRRWWPGPWISPVDVQVVTSLSRLGRRAIRRHLLIFLSQARESLWIANAYFVPGPTLLRLLCRVARRGVEVRILLPGHTDQPFVQAAGRHGYGPLLRAGVHILERQDRMLHAKATVVDGTWVILGSANLDPRSFRHNLELNLALSHPDLGRQVLRILSVHQEKSIAVDAADWARRPWHVRVWSRFAYGFRWWL